MATPILMPSVGMFTTEGTLSAWLRPAGAKVQEGDLVCEITTEKTTQEIAAPAAGIVHHAVPEGTLVPVSGVMGYILVAGEVAPAAPPPAARSTASAGPSRAVAPSAAGPAQPSSAVSASGEIRSSPVARRIAAEHNLDLSQVVGTGPSGRIVEADVLAAIARRDAAPAAAARPSAHRVRERIPLTGIRQTIAERLRASHQNTAPVTLTREVDAERLVEARGALSVRLGMSVPFDALLIKVLAAALRDRSELNATIEKDEILVLEDVHVGFAVAVSGPRGSVLFVPVIRDADTRALKDVAAAVRELSDRARNGQLKPDDLAGGTITITNLGAYGIDGFTPIINPPQSAILGIGRIQARPVIREGVLVAGQTCVLSLTFDHRVTDGVPAAQLLDAVARRLNDQEFLKGLG